MAKQNLIEKKNSGGMQPEKNFINFVKFESKRYAIPFIMLVLGLLFILLQGNVLDLFILGLISVINPSWVATFFLKVIGLCVFLNSLIRIITEHSLKGKTSKYSFYFITDIVTAAVGLLLFLFPTTWLQSVSFLFYVFGILLMVLGIFNIYTAYKVYKEGRYVNDGTDVVWEE